MAGPNGSASYGQLVTLGIMQGADPEAQAVVEYFLTEGYQDVLALAPFGKVPVLKERGGRVEEQQRLFRQLLSGDFRSDCQWVRDDAAMVIPS